MQNVRTAKSKNEIDYVQPNSERKNIGNWLAREATKTAHWYAEQKLHYARAMEKFPNTQIKWL